MRPRSRLLSKRRLLLPTIREGTEEVLRDLNEANTLHLPGHGQPVSSEDYLLSICHLAHPTFPSREAPTCNIRTRQLELQRMRLLSGTEEDTQERAEGKGAGGQLLFGNSDPLEYLYGQHSEHSVRRAFAEGKFLRQQGGQGWEGPARSRAHSVPRASSPDPVRQRKSSCPELHPDPGACAPNTPPEHSSSRSGRPADGGAEAGRRTKQSLISQWISDCRSAWREARVRACLLPTIAEI